MFSEEKFFMDISRVILAHESVLDKINKCEYPQGRGWYGMVYCISGKAEFRFNSGETLVVTDGDTLLLSPYTAYKIFTQKEFKHYTINFNIHYDSSNLDIINKPYCLLRNVNSEQFLRHFSKLTKVWAQKNNEYEMLSISQLYALISLFYFEYKNLFIASEFWERLQPAKEYIEKNFNLRMSLDQLAKMCNMSVTNFRREWQKLYHTTPMQYRDEIRLSYAKEYLISGYYSVSEVAAKCGFENAGYFIRFFEKHVGVSPGVFKRRSLIL
ncbi:MAG: helix-turn-helix transcriptional regulator [Clostridia bacterium]|nr:helix-turn-helix transcriptional regulator [Clostridia bacterium]